MLREAVQLTLARAETENGLAVFLGHKVGCLIDGALDATRKRQRRRRDLSSKVMMYLALAMTFYRTLSVPNVFRQLFCGATVVFPDGKRTVRESSLVSARYRLGAAPLKHLYERMAEQVGVPSTFHGYRVFAIDGVRFAVSDTPQNEAAFGRPKSARGQTARPVVRVVTLASTYSHEVLGINIGGWKTPEGAAVEELISNLGPNDLVILDRLYPSGALFDLFQRTGVHVVARISSTWKPKIIETLRQGDYIVEVTAKVALTAGEQAEREGQNGRPAKFKYFSVRLRMISYTCGKETIRLLTTLPTSVPALDIAKLYHERWETELVNDEVKNHLASPLHGNEELCFRSKLPEGVRQEIYATFCAHLLLRQTIRTAAETYDHHPLQISFTDSLNTVRRFLPLLQLGSPELQCLLLRELQQQIALDCQLRPRRNRQYARKVRVKMSDFKCKTRKDVQTTFDYVAQTRLTDPTLPARIRKPRRPKVAGRLASRP
jgi:hypothetical protein